MKPEHKEFIKTQAMKGCSAIFIKKELERVYQHEATPSQRSIYRWTAYFKASFQGSAFDPGSNLSSMIDKKYRNFIEKGVNNGKNLSMVSKRLWKRYGKKAVSGSSISFWYKRFKCARESSIAQINHEESTSAEANKLTERNSERLELKNEPAEIILIEDSLDSMDNSPTESQSQIGDDQNGGENKSGLNQSLEPEKILGDAVMDGIRLFMIEWKNSFTYNLCKLLDIILDLNNKLFLILYLFFFEVPVDQVKQLYPQLLINYYENKLSSY